MPRPVAIRWGLCWPTRRTKRSTRRPRWACSKAPALPTRAEAWSIIARYRNTIALRMPDALGHERLARLMPDLLRAVAAQSDATTALERVMAVVESVAKRSVYLALLAERSIALSQLVQLCAASPWIAQLLGRHPVLFDELLDPRTLYEPLAPDELDRDIAERLTALDDPDREHEMDCLRQSKQANSCGWPRRTCRAASP